MPVSSDLYTASCIVHVIKHKGQVSNQLVCYQVCIIIIVNFNFWKQQKSKE